MDGEFGADGFIERLGWGSSAKEWRERLKIFDDDASKVELAELMEALPLVGDCLKHETITGARNDNDVEVYKSSGSAIRNNGKSGLQSFRSPNPGDYDGKDWTYIKTVNVEKKIYDPFRKMDNGDLGHSDVSSEIDQTEVTVRRVTNTGKWMVWFHHLGKGQPQRFYKKTYQIEHLEDYLCEYPR